MYLSLFQCYLDAGIEAFGFGGWADAFAWQRHLGSEDSDPCIFDDDIEPKRVYYRMIGMLHNHLAQNA